MYHGLQKNMVRLEFGLHKGSRSLTIKHMVLFLDIQDTMAGEKEWIAYGMFLSGSIEEFSSTCQTKT